MSWWTDTFRGKKYHDRKRKEAEREAEIVDGIISGDEVPTNPNHLFPWMAKQGQAMQKEAEGMRKDYEIPDEVLKAYQYSQSLLGDKSAIQSGMEENASRTLAGNLSNINKGATSATQAILAGSGAQQVFGNQMNQAAMAGAQDQTQKRGEAQGMALNMGDFRDTEYDFNYNLPYLQKLQFAQDYLGTGVQGMLDLHGIRRQESMAKKDRRSQFLGNIIGTATKAGTTLAMGK